MTPCIPRTLLVIPVYNHGKTLKAVAEKAIATGFPLLVVDDGSSDGGSAALAGLNCQIHRLPENRGKGAAILAGASIADEQGFTAMITIDADDQHDPAEAFKLCAEAARTPWPAIIVGAREMVQDTVPGASHFGRAFSNFWVRIECGADLSDTQSGMRLYPVRELLQLSLSRSRYDFEIEVLVKAVWAGIPVSSVSVTVHYPPADERVSHFHKIVDNWRLTRLHTRLFFRRLLPLPHKRLIAVDPAEKPQVFVKNPLTTIGNLCREHASPFWLAVAVWFGIFLGALPLVACHTVAIIYVTHRFHLNKIAAVAASQLCMPPVIPVICIEVGYFLQTGELILVLSWEHWLLEIHHRLFDWLLGSLLVGPFLGLFVAFLVYWTSRRMQGAVENQAS